MSAGASRKTARGAARKRKALGSEDEEGDARVAKVARNQEGNPLGAHVVPRGAKVVRKRAGSRKGAAAAAAASASGMMPRLAVPLLPGDVMESCVAPFLCLDELWRVSSTCSAYASAYAGIRDRRTALVRAEVMPRLEYTCMTSRCTHDEDCKCGTATPIVPRFGVDADRWASIRGTSMTCACPSSPGQKQCFHICNPATYQWTVPRRLDEAHRFIRVLEILRVNYLNEGVPKFAMQYLREWMTAKHLNQHIGRNAIFAKLMPGAWPACARCGRIGHAAAECYASRHLNGARLEASVAKLDRDVRRAGASAAISASRRGASGAAVGAAASANARRTKRSQKSSRTAAAAAPAAPAAGAPAVAATAAAAMDTRKSACTRCGRSSHDIAKCFAKRRADGTVIAVECA
jgi:hypothetical protein